MNKPDRTLLTKIDAVILRSVEMDRDINHQDLEEFIRKEYGVEVSVAERLKIYQNGDTGFNYGLN